VELLLGLRLPTPLVVLLAAELFSRFK